MDVTFKTHASELGHSDAAQVNVAAWFDRNQIVVKVGLQRVGHFPRIMNGSGAVR